MYVCMHACIYIYVTHSHKTQDKSLIKKNEIYMCCCRPISATYTKKDIAVLVYGTE